MHFLVTVAVLVYAPLSGGAGARRAEATAALAAAERGAGAEVVDDPVGLWERGWTTEAALEFFARAARLVGEGRSNLARVELEQAEAALTRAEKIYAAELWRPGVKPEAAEAAKWHGVALFELKRREDANAAWQRAKELEPLTRLDESMVRPEVARAFAAVPLEGQGEQERTMRPDGDLGVGGRAALRDRPAARDIATLQRTLGLDAVLVAAIALDGGVLTYAATLRRPGCGSDLVTATRVDELMRRLDAAPCRADAPLAVLEAPAIAHPRPAPSLARGEVDGGRERRAPVWRKPWLWVGVVGALGVGVVLAASLWPRDATYSATVDFHQFAVSAR